jgi:molybdopterin/thiamine biosynthesis adenylyltransferase
LLTPDEQRRYSRQLLIRELGEEGQLRLKKARVVIAGAGGLGSAVAMYLAAAGIGKMRLIDHDQVELSNLNRQILHWERDIGRKKVSSASEKLLQFNSRIEVEAIGETITEESVTRLVSGCDLIVDALDNLPTRYLLNRIAVQAHRPFFHGAIRGFEGRAMTVIPGESACLACVYRGSPPKDTFPAIGTTPAVIGCIQATEVIKYVAGIGRLLTNRLLVYDGLAMKFIELTTRRDPHCRVCSGSGEQ